MKKIGQDFGTTPFGTDAIERDRLRAEDEERCSCLIPWLEGAGQHAPDCAVFLRGRP